MEIENVMISYLATQFKVSLKKAHWKGFLSRSDMTIKRWPSRITKVVNTLSRKEQHVMIVKEDETMFIPMDNEVRFLVDLQ